MTFQQLPIGEWFEFDHSDMPIASGIETGPWQKISARTYEKGGDRAMRCRVGSVNVAVIKVER